MIQSFLRCKGVLAYLLIFAPLNINMSKYFIGFLLFISHFVTAQIDQNAVDDFARNFAYRNQLPLEDVKATLSQAEFQQSIIDKMNRPAEKMSWHRYRNIFMKEERIQKGVEFWNEYETVLNRVSQQYKVDPSIIVGIIGVESYFGERKGTYRILDALYTLSFAYPRRAKFFKSELANYLLLAKKENLDVIDTRGSYAGAMGYGQFMPSSYEAYARSYEPNGDRDLMNSVEDAIASVANYFREHRWRMNEPVAQPAIRAEDAGSIPKQSIRPKNNVSYYQQLGYEPSSPISNDEKVSLQVFDAEEGDEYWFTHENFYVITRYNHSPLYALAVFQLSEAIKNKRSSH